MTSKKENCSGFTILEVLITLAILGIILASATKMLTYNIKDVQKIDRGVEYTQQLRTATNQISNEIKKGNGSKVEYSGGLLKLDNNPVLDVTPKTTNPNNARLWLYDLGNGSKELRDNNNQVLAEHIFSISVSEPPSQPFIKISIQMIADPKADAEIEPAVLSIPKTYSFSSEIPDTPEDPKEVWKNLVTFSQYLEIQDAQIIGPTTSVFVDDNNGDTLVIRNSNTKIKTARIYIKKNLEIWDAVIGMSDGSSQVYVQGNVTLHNQANILGTLYYTGSLSRPLPNAQQVPSIDFPDLTIPPPQPDSWYVERGFTSNTNPINGMKYKGGSITFDNAKVSDVCIYSSGNITLQNSNTAVSGILYAPYGSVAVKSGSTFNGIIIANIIYVHNSNTTVTFQSFETDDLPF